LCNLRQKFGIDSKESHHPIKMILRLGYPNKLSQPEIEFDKGTLHFGCHNITSHCMCLSWQFCKHMNLGSLMHRKIFFSLQSNPHDWWQKHSKYSMFDIRRFCLNCQGPIDKLHNLSKLKWYPKLRDKNTHGC
jgi:hypothetical protein